jgi:hypothetical protein
MVTRKGKTTTVVCRTAWAAWSGRGQAASQERPRTAYTAVWMPLARK